MNEGIKILIARMQTNPEDFAPSALDVNRYAADIRYNSWRHLAEFATTSEVFTETERNAVTAALDEVTRKNFTAKILELLAAPTEDETRMQQYAFRESMKNMVMMGAIQSPSKQQYNNYQAAQQQKLK